jgi:hypothetical protein
LLGPLKVSPGLLAQADTVLRQVADGLLTLAAPERIYRLFPANATAGRQAAALAVTLLGLSEALGDFHDADLRDSAIAEATGRIWRIWKVPEFPPQPYPLFAVTCH